MINSTYYKLNPDHTYTPCGINELRQSANANKIARTYISNEVFVSTVFLQVNHQYIEGEEPILFETMLFVRGECAWSERASTWNEAMQNHNDAVAKFR